MASSGMEGLTPVVETTAITVTIPYTSYTTLIQGTTSTITQYQTYTMTKTRTKWKTTTTTVKEGYPVYITVTTTKTKYVFIEDQMYAHGYSAVILYWPYSEFVFIAG